MSDRSFEWMINPLLDCASSKFQEMTPEKYVLLELICHIIRVNTIDLHNKKANKRRVDAENYFNSARFIYHCECLAIPPNIVLYIINNPQKHNKRAA